LPVTVRPAVLADWLTILARESASVAVLDPSVPPCDTPSARVTPPLVVVIVCPLVESRRYSSMARVTGAMLACVM
jgi:hypothetical protein